MPTAEVLLEEVNSLRQTVSEKDQAIAVLKEQVQWLRNQLFGSSKSERLDTAQLLLKLEEVQAQLKNEEKQQVSYERKVPKAGKHETPAERFKDLPVEETLIIEPEEVSEDPEAFEQISVEETFEVDIHPPKLFKRRLLRPKYRRRKDRSEPPVIAPAPKRVIEGSYASAGLLAWVVLSKYVQHMPLYRQEKASVMWGAPLSRKTMADWIEAVAEWLKPIYNYMLSDLLKGDYIQADETPIRYCDPDFKKGKSKQGWLWAISRPKGDVIFDWRLSRRHEELPLLLKGYQGLLQSDGYGAYDSYVQGKAMIALGCMAHARRKFFNALKSSRRESALILKLIGKLYHFEEAYRQEKLNPDQRYARRQVDQKNLLKWLHIVIRISLKRSLPRSSLGQACSYALKNWGKLTEYLNHGVAEIDNNLMENAIRPSALGKKNFLFVGHPDAGQRSAIIYSLVVSCQRHGVDPLSYLKDVLTRLPQMSNQDNMAELAPSNWSISTT